MVRTMRTDEDSAATEVAATVILDRFDGFDGSDDGVCDGSAHGAEAEAEEDVPPAATPDESAPL